MTIRLDPELPRGYEVAEAVTFDPGPAIKVLREYLPTAIYLVEGPDPEAPRMVTAPFPPGEISGPYEVVAFPELATAPASRVVVRSEDHTAEEFAETAARAGLHGVNYAVGWTAWLDLAPAGVSKASALEGVRQLLGVPIEATLAVGDGRNDLEMFAWAGRSVAMGQAIEEVKAAAGELTGSVQDDGVAQLLEALGPA
jgi:hydroxymethylpyrimidine pyrophosphatase-like HAD family hydrolase